jgi:hypothetical protein
VKKVLYLYTTAIGNRNDACNSVASVAAESNISEIMNILNI